MDYYVSKDHYQLTIDESDHSKKFTISSYPDNVYKSSDSVELPEEVMEWIIENVRPFRKPAMRDDLR